ncbi:Fat-like cadherin-related tumor suppressor-like protein [Sarcoptes scabiei]|nr:Fat-like cadherin-related tumor suppressor-like protein [Sarcoptes scabiei]
MNLGTSLSITSMICFMFVSLLSIHLAHSRNYEHSATELSLTNQVVINQRDCYPNETPIFVHTAAATNGKYFQRRQVIRRTWAREASKYNMRVLFVMGVPKDLSIERSLKAEADLNHDLLQFNFVENYYNLTLKAISLLKWSYRHCSQSLYMVKTDDDVVLNMPMLYQLVKQRKIPSGLTGLVMTTPANREQGHKWHMPEHLYPKNSYEFLAGFSYLLSMDKLKSFLKTIVTYPGPILDIDDLFLTGIVADYGRIRRNNSFRFKFFCGTDVCTMETSLAMHACPSAKNSEYMYRFWKNADRLSCYKHFRINRNFRRPRRSLNVSDSKNLEEIESKFIEHLIQNNLLVGFRFRSIAS